MPKLDYATISKFRAIIIEKNKLWCPDPATRLRVLIQEHYLERLFERFTTSKEQGQVLVETMAWIKKNYARLQNENTWGKKIQYRAHLSDNNTSVLILFNGQLSLRTCFKHGVNDES